MAGNSMPLIPLAFSTLLLVLHPNNFALILAQEPTTATTTVVSKDGLPCSTMCSECENPCQPLSPPPPVVYPPPPPPSPPPPELPECPPPPAPPPAPIGPECPPPPPVPSCPDTCILPPPGPDGGGSGGGGGGGGGTYPRPPMTPGLDSPPVSYYPNYYTPPPNSSFRLRIHEATMFTSTILFLAFICYL